MVPIIGVVPLYHFTGRHTVSEGFSLSCRRDETDSIEKNMIPIVAGSDRKWRLWHDDVIICALHKALLGQS